MLLHYKEHLSKLVKQIDALTNEVEEYEIIQSIPGIGEKIAATIISELWFIPCKWVGNSVCVDKGVELL
jgi:Holliday junction resolvasome RuvABC DNA-binding subunit